MKLAAYGMLGLSLPDFSQTINTQSFDDDLQGRVIDKSLWMYTEPTPESERVEMFWRDLVVLVKGRHQNA